MVAIFDQMHSISTMDSGIVWKKLRKYMNVWVNLLTYFNLPHFVTLLMMTAKALFKDILITQSAGASNRMEPAIIEIWKRCVIRRPHSSCLQCLDYNQIESFRRVFLQAHELIPKYLHNLSRSKQFPGQSMFIRVRHIQIWTLIDTNVISKVLASEVFCTR